MKRSKLAWSKQISGTELNEINAFLKKKQLELNEPAATYGPVNVL